MRFHVLIGAASAVLLSSTSALAVIGGTPDRLADQERAQRVEHPAAQRQLDASPAWQDFLSRHGGAWTAQWDEATRTPTRFWGTGWNTSGASLSDDTAAFRLGMAILAQEIDLLGGVGTDDLAPLAIDRRQGITTLSFERTWRGLSVENARVSLRFKNDRFVMGQFESMPAIEATLRVSEPSVAAKDATQTALSELGWVTTHTEEVNQPKLTVYPIVRVSSVDYRLAWKLELRSTAFPSRQYVFIDAQTGEFISSREQVRFLDTQVSVEHDDRYPDNGTATSPFRWAEVEVDGVETSADMDGVITTEGPGTATWTSGSRYFRVRTADGDPMASFSGQITEGGAPLLAQPDPDLDPVKYRRVLAQVDTHVAAHRARERALRINPNFGWASQQVEATVNSEEMTCNAWFDGDINFVTQADGCNNTGRVMDVVSHEYGHGFHAYSIINGVGSFDGALSEGMGDYLAATISGDPATARGFFQGSNDPLRDIEINRVWPEDVGEIHQTGRIIAGALWDARKALITVMGEEQGIDHADQLFWAVASRASDIPTGYSEALLADDDNGDLSDGTPNQCLIDEAFGLHGLGPASDDIGLFSVEHAPITNLTPDDSIEVSARVQLARPACTTGEVGSVRLSWALGGDAFETLTMDAAGEGDFVASLPGAEAGTELRYFIEVLDENDEVSGLMPRGSISDPWFAAFVAGGTIIFESDFEDDDGGFSHELLVGNADSEGADDWQWGEPGGDSGDPSSAFSGDNVWGNDLSPEENWNGAYQPNVHNILSSPRIDVGTGYDTVYLQFRRWLSVEDGFFDTAEVTVNGIGLWSQLEGPNQNDAGNHHEDLHWALRTYDITDLVAADGSIVVNWELLSDGGLQFGGWNIDDVKVIGLGEAGGIGDPQGDDLAGGGTGCSCDSGGDPSPSAWLFILPLLGFVTRRRYSATTR